MAQPEDRTLRAAEASADEAAAAPADEHAVPQLETSVTGAGSDDWWSQPAVEGDRHDRD